jgi:hypothetical protein
MANVLSFIRQREILLARERQRGVDLSALAAQRQREHEAANWTDADNARLKRLADENEQMNVELQAEAARKLEHGRLVLAKMRDQTAQHRARLADCEKECERNKDILRQMDQQTRAKRDVLEQFDAEHGTGDDDQL